MFFNNTGLLVELEGSTDIRRKEGRSLVEESIVGAVLECKTYEIRDITNEFLQGIYPNKTTRGRIRPETLFASGAKRDSNVAIVWTMRHQELKIFFSGSVPLVVFLNKTMNSIMDLT